MTTRKGKAWHKRSGKIFFYAMLTSALLALVIAVLPGHFSPFLFSIGVFTTYLLLSGYGALRYRLASYNPRTGRIISIAMLVCAAGMVMVPLLVNGELDVVLAVFGGIGLAFALRDLRLYGRPERLRQAWLKQHIGKMTGAYIASVTAFLVVNEFMPHYLNWLLPTVLGSLYIAYWSRRINPEKAGKVASFVILFLGVYPTTDGQVYLEKQSRHRFAQLNLGLEYQTSIGCQSSFRAGRAE